MESIFSVLKKHDMGYGHYFSPALDYDYLKLDASLSEREVIDAIVKEGSICFSVGDENGSYGMGVFPEPSEHNTGIVSDRMVKEGEEDNALYGDIGFDWERLSGEGYNQALFAKTLKVVPDFYEALHPIYGQSCEENLMESRFYNLIPTKRNIFKNGPRDLFDINLWSPEMVKKIDTSLFEREESLSTVKFPDGGLMIYISPEQYVSGDRGGLKRMEKVLGWYREGRTDTRWEPR